MDVVIFGTGMVTQSIYSHVLHDEPFRVVAFCVDDAYGAESRFANLPVIPLSRIAEEYPPSQCSMLVAMGYHELNRVRADHYSRIKAMGYKLQNYISPRASLAPDAELGDNCIIMPHVSIQAGVCIGSNVIIYDNTTIAHHSTLEDNLWICAGVTVAGKSRIGANTFIGVGATLGHRVSVGAFNFIGAGALLTHSTAPKEVHIAPDTPKYRLDSDAFLRFTHFD